MTRSEFFLKGADASKMLGSIAAEQMSNSFESKLLKYKNAYTNAKANQQKLQDIFATSKMSTSPIKDNINWEERADELIKARIALHDAKVEYDCAQEEYDFWFKPLSAEEEKTLRSEFGRK